MAIQASSAAPAHAAASDFDEGAWQAVIGPKNDGYYLSRFAATHRNGEVARWHWPAFFVTWYWLLYRKMWMWAAIYFFAPAVLAVVLGAVVAMVAPQAGAGWVVWLYFALIFFGPPLLANGLYHDHCHGLMREARKGASGREHYLARLEARGGTSNIALLLVLGLVFGVALIGILAAISLPAYHDYTQRAKVAEAVASGRAIAIAVGERFEADGRLPDNLDALSATAPRSKYLKAVRIDPNNGTISLSMELSPTIAGTIQLVPAMDANRRLSWTCTTRDLKKYAPKSCRD